MVSTERMSGVIPRKKTGDGLRVDHGRAEAIEEVSESSKGIWGWVSAVALLGSMGFSWHLMTMRSVLSADAGRKDGRKPGLLAAVSQRPSLSSVFRNFLADIVWLEAVQVSGNMKMTREDYDRLYELLNVVANFDPRFEIPYLLGGMLLGESPDHAQEALRILGRGRASHPGDWRFPFYIGYTYYFSLGDAGSAGESMMEAARLPGSATYLAGLASRMLAEARDPESAMSFLETIARQESDPARRSVLERRIREVAVERDLQILERAVERYLEKTGSLPSRLADLVREGALAEIPVEPNGGNYLLERGGKVRSDRVAERLRVFQHK